MRTLSYLTLIIILFPSCVSTTDSQKEEFPVADPGIEEIISEEIVLEDKGIRLTGGSLTEPFKDATLSLTSINGESGPMNGANSFEFKVENYALGAQTADVNELLCANSQKGQHIHFILNNEPYNAFYEPSFEKELEEGHYIMLAFLSRSYHMSLKNDAAHVLKEFWIGEQPDQESIGLNNPHMFYSRPKGSYIGKDNAERVLLDFYLANCVLSEDGFKVRVTFNNDVSFLLTDWSPYMVEGLPMGSNIVKLELLDSDDNLVDSPFNPVERTIVLAEDEPIEE